MPHRTRFVLTRRLFVVLAISLVCSLVLLTRFITTGFTQEDQQVPTSTKNSKLSNDSETEALHTSVGAYYSIENNLNAKLLLNNKGIKPLEVRPTLYNLAGQQLELPPVFVEASSFRFINLSEWAAVGGESFKQGSIKLFHRGKDLVLGAQIYLTDEERSLSFEEKLAEIGKYDSRRLEGVWAMPSRETDVKIALSNTVDCELTVTARLTRKPHVTSEPQTFTLAPHETRVLDLRRDFPGGNQSVNSEAVALSLEHSGTKESLLARAFISDASRGYSNLAQFSNPFAGKTEKYHGAGLHLETVDGERLKPVVVVRNTADTDANLTG